jgi:hypothetical protein
LKYEAYNTHVEIVEPTFLSIIYKNMSNGKHVHFVAHKPVKEPAFISFQTKDGPVGFNGHKIVEEAVVVDFDARRK